jgi:ribonuclease-3
MLWDNIKNLEKNINYNFKNKKYIKIALTHSSYANEAKNKYNSNERLEFLGDSVLGIVVSDYIFKYCPSLPEGELTKLRSSLVCEKTLHEFSKSIYLGKFLMLSRGEKKSGGDYRSSILADAFEALIAAIYLDGGLEEARKFILKFIIPKLESCKDKNSDDYKSILQEIIQKKYEDKLNYIMKGEEGPDHDKQFFVEVYFNNSVIGNGSGKSKKQAEQCAAKQALEYIKSIENKTGF